MSATTTNTYAEYAAAMAEAARLRVIRNARNGFKFCAVTALFFSAAFVFFAVGAFFSSGLVAVAFSLFMVFTCGLNAFYLASEARYYWETVREYTAKAPLC